MKDFTESVRQLIYNREPWSGFWIKKLVEGIKKEIAKRLPLEADVRPEITEWLWNKNRDHAEGYNEALKNVKKALEVE